MRRTSRRQQPELVLNVGRAAGGARRQVLQFLHSAGKLVGRS